MCKLLLIVCVFTEIVSGETVIGKCVSVTDGDTITVLEGKTQHKIRLHGIDAPESKQDYGQRAKQTLSEMVFSQTVEIDVLKTDRYGRLVGKIYVGDTYINLQLVKLGLAWWYKQYAKDDHDLENAEKEARTNKVGLWSRSDAIPPWQYRSQKRLKRNS